MVYVLIAIGVLCLIALCIIFMSSHFHAEKVQKAKQQEELKKTPVKRPFNPDEVLTFDKKDYQALYHYFKQNTVVHPNKDPYAFNGLCKELAVKFITLGLLNTPESLKDSYSVAYNIKPRAPGTSSREWQEVLSDYRYFEKQSSVRLDEYVYAICSFYTKVFTGRLIFANYPIFSPESNYSIAMTVISRQCGSDNVHNEKYGPAILLYYTLHMQTVVKILENQRRVSEDMSNPQTYLKYLEDELGLSKIVIDKEVRDFIKPPSSIINTDVSPLHLAKGVISND